ncbi:MAG: hypothetical protein WBW37_19100, partial [Methyloceanibacter sp.]
MLTHAKSMLISFMFKTTPEHNKALVLEAFDALFNKRDYTAVERFWSETYIQHSAHSPPGSLPESGGGTEKAVRVPQSKHERVARRATMRCDWVGVVWPE